MNLVLLSKLSNGNKIVLISQEYVKKHQKNLVLFY